MVKVILFSILSTISIALSAQNKMTKQSYTDSSSSVTVGYWLYLPAEMDADTPLIVYLHGGSSKGDDLDILIENDGFPQYLYNGDLGDVGAVVVIPQLSSGTVGWANIATTVKSLIIEVCKTQGLTSHHVNLTGHSMGGTGTWAIALRYPQLFDKIAPMSGSVTASQENATALVGIKVWACVGSDDTIVAPESSCSMIELLKETGGDARLTVFDGAGHFDVPALAYKDTELGMIQWLSNQIDDTALHQPSSTSAHKNQFYDITGRPTMPDAHGLVINNGRLIFKR